MSTFKQHWYYELKVIGFFPCNLPVGIQSCPSVKCLVWSTQTYTKRQDNGIKLTACKLCRTWDHFTRAVFPCLHPSCYQPVFMWILKLVWSCSMNYFLPPYISSGSSTTSGWLLRKAFWPPAPGYFSLSQTPHTTSPKWKAWCNEASRTSMQPWLKGFAQPEISPPTGLGAHHGLGAYKTLVKKLLFHPLPWDFVAKNQQHTRSLHSTQLDVSWKEAEERSGDRREEGSPAPPSTWKLSETTRWGEARRKEDIDYSL